MPCHQQFYQAVAVDACDGAKLAALLPVAARVVCTGTGDVVDVAHIGCADEVVYAPEDIDFVVVPRRALRRCVERSAEDMQFGA